MGACVDISEVKAMLTSVHASVDHLISMGEMDSSLQLTIASRSHKERLSVPGWKDAAHRQSLQEISDSARGKSSPSGGEAAPVPPDLGGTSDVREGGIPRTSSLERA